MISPNRGRKRSPSGHPQGGFVALHSYGGNSKPLNLYSRTNHFLTFISHNHFNFTHGRGEPSIFVYSKVLQHHKYEATNIQTLHYYGPLPVYAILKCDYSIGYVTSTHHLVHNYITDNAGVYQFCQMHTRTMIKQLRHYFFSRVVITGIKLLPRTFPRTHTHSLTHSSTRKHTCSPGAHTSSLALSLAYKHTRTQFHTLKPFPHPQIIVHTHISDTVLSKYTHTHFLYRNKLVHKFIFTHSLEF